MQVGIHQSAVAGISMGGIQLILFCSYALGLFYGSTRVASGHYTGGQVRTAHCCHCCHAFAALSSQPGHLLMRVFVCAPT
jgi:hypothetical protein